MGADWLVDKKKRIAIWIIIILGLLLIYTFIEPYWIEFKTITIESPEVPAQFQNTKIVFFNGYSSWSLFFL